MAAPTKILVLFYSTYGHVYHMAMAAESGAKKAGAEVRLRRIHESLPIEVLEKMGAVEAQKAFQHVEEVTPEDILWADGSIWATPTRFGNVPSQVKTFMDRLGHLWMEQMKGGGILGRAASATSSAGSQHGGLETTILCGLWPFFAHMGLVIVGLPYSFVSQTGVEEVKGGSPYGASTIAGGSGERLPSATDLAGATYQGEHLTNIARALSISRGAVPIILPPPEEEKKQKKRET